jgi:hypothetical protein
VRSIAAVAAAARRDEKKRVEDFLCLNNKILLCIQASIDNTLCTVFPRRCAELIILKKTLKRENLKNGGEGMS